MSNQWCHLCRGLVDLINLQPRDVRLCDCKSKRAADKSRIAALEAERDGFRALLNWSAGRLLDAGDVEGHEKVLAAPELKGGEG